jgi:hypothetical protein
MSREEPCSGSAARETETDASRFRLAPFESVAALAVRLEHHLRRQTLTAKVAFLWLNTELRGCQATAWATM